MSVFDRQDDKSIRKWCKWSWNPITGCEYDCRYCHAVEKIRKLYSRTRNQAYESFQPRLWPERFDAPHNTTVPKSNASGNRNVLVGHLGDMFGDWVEKEHLEIILKLIGETPQWNYILLTKNPKRYLDFALPPNCWIGVKIDKQQEVRPAIEIFNCIEASIRFISCDPMVTWLQFPTLECFNWMIIGPKPKTKTGPAFYPPKMWIRSIIKQAKGCGCKVFVKHLGDPMHQQYPGADPPLLEDSAP